MDIHVAETGPEGFKCDTNGFGPARDFFGSILPRQDEHEGHRFPGWGDLPTCQRSSSSLKDTRVASKENPCVCFTLLGPVQMGLPVREFQSWVGEISALFSGQNAK